MGLVYIKNVSQESILGLWEHDPWNEDLQLTPSEQIAFKAIRTVKRKTEWLSVRLLLQSMFKDKKKEIVYDLSGKPRLSDNSHYISISHSGKYVTVLLAENKNVGIDIQLIKKSILAAPGYFLNQKEMARLPIPGRLEMMHIYWGAKEAIYKYCNKTDLNIKEDIFIEPFDFQQKKITGHIKVSEKITTLQLQYEQIGDYILVFTC